MNLIVFASFIIFVLWFTVNLKKTEKNNKQMEEEFWERESRANSVRKKSLDHLPYITFDFDALPTASSFTESGAQIPESLEILQNLRDKKMLNLNGISNTDLKLKYGAPNITRLSEYEENFTVFSIHRSKSRSQNTSGKNDRDRNRYQRTLPAACPALSGRRKAR